ncbi:uncharacterized protein AB675_4725 [Cyphellophora attinorum]|uniref:Uncharacterized protein n=1 Tax=Cyphellophora attinorum TaxID=1664694 RepID=A0A0N1NZR6_9EURO|nr:uncharacterized protein AB675_4725 [Phialophora attinorum]KPI39173.1 hypothetical protein AB675_4725 [Phialophora attinorum]
MTAPDRASKRVKVEVDPHSGLQSGIPAQPKFVVGDKVYKVYKSTVSQAVRITLFEITDRAYSGTDGWSYRIKNDDFLGEGCVLWVTESHLYTVKYSLGKTFQFRVEGTADTTYTTGAVTGWSLVDGKVVYDIKIPGTVERHDKLSLDVKLDGLEVKAQSCEGKFAPADRYDAQLMSSTYHRNKVVLVTHCTLGTVQVPADKVDRIAMGY